MQGCCLGGRQRHDDVESVVVQLNEIFIVACSSQSSSQPQCYAATMPSTAAHTLVLAVTSRTPPRPFVVQLYTQVEAFAAAISKLRELGFNVNTEESELVYRGTAGGPSNGMISPQLPGQQVCSSVQ